MSKIILGIDEVGRGPYAGPLVIGACILPTDRENHPWISELNDSKQLPEHKREELYVKLKRDATTATGWVSSKELDEIGMSKALRLATRRAVEKIQKEKVPFNEVIIDGISNFLSGTALGKYATTLKKADEKIKEVSGASIVAKVERDHYMKDLALTYPGYGFETNAGYGTFKHQRAMETLGLTPEHRRSFAPVAKIAKLEKPEKSIAGTNKEKGNAAEEKIANFLLQNGHEILARNFKTKAYEIDIISRCDNKLYFTEVKSHQNNSHGSAKSMITKKKLEQMTFAANAFMAKSAQRLASNFASNPQNYQLAVGTIDGEKLDWFPID